MAPPRVVSVTDGVPATELVDSPNSDGEGDGDDGKTWARCALLVMSLVCGTNFSLVKLLEESHSEASVALVRFSLGMLPFLGCLKAERKVALAGLEIGAWGAFGYITQAVGLHSVSDLYLSGGIARSTTTAPHF